MVEVVGVYPVREAEEPCHLVEIVVSDAPGFDVGEITQKTPWASRKSWQVPYDERLLNAAGDEVVPTQWPIPPERLTDDVRLAFFFHYLDFDRPLETPFGPVRLPEPTERPSRLDWLQYEEP